MVEVCLECDIADCHHIRARRESEKRRQGGESSSTAWHEYLMGFARHAATKSKDSTKVGAVLVGPDKTVLLTAYNGPPRGVRDLPERRERPEKYLWASHAEANLIAFAARQGIRTEGCTVYVTHHPCASCARTLIQAGVVSVMIGDGSTRMPDDEFRVAAEMFEEAVVSVSKV